jgi:hypothetical protein
MDQLLLFRLGKKMKECFMKSILRIPFLAVIAVLFVQCQETAVNSVWNENQIQIDGVFSDWQSRLIRDEKSGAIFGISNDSDNLYLCLTTSDRATVRQIMRGGLIIALHIKAARGKQFGIKFPTAIEGMPFEGGWERGSGRMDRSDDEQNRFRMFRDTQTELVLLGPGKGEMQIVPLMNPYGLKVALGQAQRQFVYELQIPFELMSSHLGIKPPQPSAVIGVTFKTGKMEFARDFRGGPPDDFEGGESPVGGLPGRGRMGGGPGGSGEIPGRQFSDMQVFEYHLKVTLAGPK